MITRLHMRQNAHFAILTRHSVKLQLTFHYFTASGLRLSSVFAMLNGTTLVSKPSCLPAGLHTFDSIASALGLILNATLAWLIMFRTEKELQSYRRVLICSCCVDSAFSLMSYVFEVVSGRTQRIRQATTIP